MEVLLSKKYFDLEIKYLIYKPRIYPLEGFLKRVIHGEFKELTSSLDFTYKEKTFENNQLDALVEVGLIPVYLKIKNRKNILAKFSIRNLRLAHGDKSFLLIKPKNLPKIIKEFNLLTFGKNIYNASVFVVTMGAFLLTTSASGLHGRTPVHLQKGKYFGKEKKSLDYQNLLFRLEGQLKPVSEQEGLVFFQLKKENIYWDKLSLKLD